MLGRSTDNLFDANDTALPHTGSQTASSIDSLLSGLSSMSSSPLLPVRDAVTLLTKPQNYVDKAKIDAWRVSLFINTRINYGRSTYQVLPSSCVGI